MNSETASPPAVYEFGDFRLELEEHRLVHRDGKAVTLTPRVFATLRYLVEHSGQILSKDVLMKAVWPDCVVEENNLAQNVSHLRRVFGDTAGSQRYIATVPGRGYRFAMEVVAGVGDPGSVAQTSLPSEPPGSPTPATARLVFAIAAGVLVVCGIALFSWRAQRQPAVTAGSVAPPIAERSIAVLPFANLSDDKENAYFAAGIHDDLLTSLAQIHELKVISRTSVMSYQSTERRNMRETSQALGVAHVLEGSVRRDGNRVLVNVQLIDARSDAHLWAQRYDRTLADSIGLQGELAAHIAAALRARLAPKEKQSLETKPTGNPEAYALYLQGRGREGAINPSKEDRVAAVQSYTAAVALDPAFALAYAHRSIVKSKLAYDAGAQLLRAEARADAEEALRLSPSLGEAHAALGISLYRGDKDYSAALREFSMAVAALPNDPSLFAYMAAVHRRQGRWSEALAVSQRAVDLDPRNGDGVIRAANGLAFVRDWSGARAAFNRARGVVPDSAYPQIGLAYLEVFQNQDPAAGSNILQSIAAGVDPDGEVTSARWDLAMLERNYGAAEKLLADFRGETFPKEDATPTAFYHGRTALARGDIAAAERYFIAATPALEAHVRNDPDDLDWRARLALLYAYRQRKDDAVREARDAVAKEPESDNAYYGAFRVANLALVYALVGEQDEAITLIERLLSTPGPVQWPDYPMSMTLADLRLRWEWDSLRSNPRFQKILAGPEPKTALASSAEGRSE